ncbi:MAG TPA: hypothetical protein DCX60_06105, partial [Phycisphaerales bacterium]|nr:hypothetical protein [Phycisphaerales bacterium]
FKLQFREEGGPLFGAPPAYAFWASPKTGVQMALFGDVVLEGADLAVVVGWEQLLGPDDRHIWLNMIQEGLDSGRLEPQLETLKRLDPSPPAALLKVLRTSMEQSP